MVQRRARSDKSGESGPGTPFALADAGHVTAACELASRLAGLLARHFLCRVDRLAYATRKGNPCPVDVGADKGPALLSHVLGPAAGPVRLRAVPRRCPEGYSVRGPFRLGSYTPAPGPDGLTVYAVLDFDGGAHSSPLADPLGAALRVLEVFRRAGLACHLELSRSGTGWHIWVLFARPVRAAVVRRVLRALLPEDLKAVEVFPKSDSTDYMGNQVWLPWWHRAEWPCNQFHETAEDGTVTPYLPDTFAAVEPEALERLDPGEPPPGSAPKEEVNRDDVTVDHPPRGAQQGNGDGELRTPAELLEWALGRLRDGRNNAAYDLGCQLRDSGVPQAEAERWAGEFARRCPAGNHSFPEEEALGAIRSAYDGTPRRAWRKPAHKPALLHSFARAKECELRGQVSAPTPLLALPDPPSWGDCPAPNEKPILRHKVRRDEYMVVAAPCRHLNCPVCWACRLWHDAHHFAGKFLAFHPGALVHCGLLTADTPEALLKRWQAAYRRCFRPASLAPVREGYVRLGVDPLTSSLFASTPLPGTQGLPPEEAVRRFGAAVRALRRPEVLWPGRSYGTWSRNWKPPRPKPNPGRSWDVVGVTHVAGRDALAAYLRGKGLPVATCAPGTEIERWRVAWKCPGSWLHEEQRRVVLDVADMDDPW
jgi:hypothetical protein